MSADIRAALAKPVGEGPSDEELIDWHSNAYCPDVDEVNDEEDSMFQYTSAYLRWLDEHGTQEQQSAHEAKGLRAVFEAGQRYGAQSAPPTPEPGEVAELVEFLDALAATPILTAPYVAQIRRAATLLQQLSAPAPAPVPVAERPWDRVVGWCDAEGRCWFLEGNYWILDYSLRLPVETLASIYSLSLPAHAIPLPQAGEEG